MPKFVWYDIMTTDTTAAATFYESVVGWTKQPAGPDYWTFSSESSMAAGLMPIPPGGAAQGMRPCWTGYIGVDDVDAYAGRVRDHGGAIHRGPEDIPGIGRFAVAADPQGAVFILFKPNSSDGPSDEPGTGRIGWHELQATDLVAELAFYRDLFDWTAAGKHDMGPMGTYELLATGEQPDIGAMKKMDPSPVPYWLYYIWVEAADAAIERVKRAGGSLINGPMEVPGGAWSMQCMDPQGAVFALVAPTR